MERISLAAPRFAIPKKNRKIEEAEIQKAEIEPEARAEWQEVQPNTAQFSQLEGIVRQHVTDPNLRLVIFNAAILNNPWLTHRFEKYGRFLKSTGQPDKDQIAFCQISALPQEIEYIGLNGLAIGNSLNNDLGNQEYGVYLANNIDLISPQSFFVSARAPCTIRVLICKVLKGKINQVGLGSKDLDPTSGYGCHMAKVMPDNARKRRRVDLFRHNLLYMYEIDENLEPRLVPSGVLPYAYIDIAADKSMLNDKRIRLPRFELSNSMYNAKFNMFSKSYAVNFFNVGEETWKPLGVDPEMEFKHFINWSFALQSFPLLELCEGENFGNLLNKKEIQLSNGWFATYFILQPPVPSNDFSLLIDFLTTNRMIGFCLTSDNGQVFLIPPGDLAIQLGFASHIENVLHLVVTQIRSFYGFYPETLKQIILSNRHPSNIEIIQGFHQQLEDYIVEEFDLHINNDSGINAKFRITAPSKNIETKGLLDLENLPENAVHKSEIKHGGPSNEYLGNPGQSGRRVLLNDEPRQSLDESGEESATNEDPRRFFPDIQKSLPTPSAAVQNFRDLFSKAIGKANDFEKKETLEKQEDDVKSDMLGLDVSALSETKRVKTKISEMPMPPNHKKDEYDPGTVDFTNEAIGEIDEDIENAPSPESGINFDTFGETDQNNKSPSNTASPYQSPDSTPTDDEDLRIGSKKVETTEDHVNALVFRTIFAKDIGDGQEEDQKRSTRKLEDFLSVFSSRPPPVAKVRIPSEDTRIDHLNSPPPPASPIGDEQTTFVRAIPLEEERKPDASSVMDVDERANTVSFFNRTTHEKSINQKLMFPPLTKNQEMAYKQQMLRNLSQGLQINPGVLHSSQMQRSVIETKSEPLLNPTLSSVNNPAGSSISTTANIFSSTSFSANHPPNLGLNTADNRFNNGPSREPVNPWRNNDTINSMTQDCHPNRSLLDDEGPASPDLEEGELEENRREVKTIPSSSEPEPTTSLVHSDRQITRQAMVGTTTPLIQSGHIRPVPAPTRFSPHQPLLPHPGASPWAHFNSGFSSTSPIGRMPVPPAHFPNFGFHNRPPRVTIIIPDGMLFVMGTTLKPDLLEAILQRLTTLNQGPDKYVMHLHSHCWKSISDRCKQETANPKIGNMFHSISTIIERYQQCGVVKQLNEHGCDLGNRSIDSIVACLRQIREVQKAQTTVIFMSNVSMGAVFGQKIVKNGFVLESPLDLRNRIASI